MGGVEAYIDPRPQLGTSAPPSMPVPTDRLRQIRCGSRRHS
jgi:hypothetical protein